jgi:signal transduction histidine kinase
MIFGYYWLLLEAHSSKTGELISSLTQLYYEENALSTTDNLRELKFKRIAELLINADKPFMMTNLTGENEIPVFWNKPPLIKNSETLLEYFKKNNSSVLTLIHGTSAKRIYYIPDDMIRKIRYYPLFLLLSLALIVLIMFYLYMFMRKNEKQSIWIAMSKETAHQLGTPLTSLKGWREYISGLSESNDDLDALEDGLREDIEKISVVVDRFSNISSDKDFRMCDIGSIIDRVTDYISRRLPLESGKISIEKIIGDVPNIYANEVLLEWTIENLLKNSIESLQDRSGGRIVIEQYGERNRIIIEIRDNGSGIPTAIRRNIFETGFTTKKRGWGLGLSLSKKVIEQYHKGKLYIKHTGPEGTVIRIELNKYI